MVQWGDFLAQIGAYPETIKDTMKSSGVPSLFILPSTLFDIHNGISLAEVEFPLYYNFYVRGQKLRFICRPEQQRPLVRLLKEAVFGPSSFRLEREYQHGAATVGVPDLKAEGLFYKTVNGRRQKLADLIDPIVCSTGSSVTVDGVEITLLDNDEFRFCRDAQAHTVAFKPLDPPVFSHDGSSHFQPPDFGITVLGAGHGFDVNSQTSGFILWIESRGLLVDPPVHTTQWMKARNLDQRLVEDILLTHCHADHDSGTLQKVMEEGRVRLHTTPTVMGSFVRKYRSLIGLDSEELQKLFDFQPLLVGTSINILGARFRFWYTLHPIPTLGFVAEYKGKTFAYSCDTLYDPEVFAQLHQQGVMSEARRRTLEQFPWNADLIFHEAGMPPVHTPIGVLASQPQEVRDRMFLTHVSPDIIGSETRLRIAPTDIANTIDLVPYAPVRDGAERALSLLDLFLHAEIFTECALHKSLEFLHIAQTVELPAGQEVVSGEEWGSQFFLVSLGEVGLFREERLVRTLRRYDFFGEVAIVLDMPRFAVVRTLTDCELVMVARSDFLKFIANTELPELLQRVALNRMNDLWPVMKANRSLAPLSPFQRGQLLGILEPRDCQPGEVLYSAGGLPLELYLIAEGKVRLSSPTGATREAGRGALLGRFPEKDRLVTHEVTATVLEPTRLFVASLAKLRGFFRRNPGTFVRLSRVLRSDPFSHTW